MRYTVQYPDIIASFHFPGDTIVRLYIARSQLNLLCFIRYIWQRAWNIDPRNPYPHTGVFINFRINPHEKNLWVFFGVAVLIYRDIMIFFVRSTLPSTCRPHHVFSLSSQLLWTNSTVRCRYNPPNGRGMGCLWWIHHRIDILSWVPAIIHATFYYIGPWYNGIRLHVH